MYELSDKHIGDKVMEIMDSITLYEPIKNDMVRLLRNTATPEVYRMIVRRGKQGHYVSDLYKILYDLGYIKA